MVAFFLVVARRPRVQVPHTRGSNHYLPDVPKSFCERNGGVVFLRGPRAAAIMDEWVAEFEPASKDGIDVRDEMRAKAKLVDPVVVGRFERNLANDGHDQMALRAVLYRHRTDLFDLPAGVQVISSSRAGLFPSELWKWYNHMVPCV